MMNSETKPATESEETQQVTAQAAPLSVADKSWVFRSRALLGVLFVSLAAGAGYIGWLNLRPKATEATDTVAALHLDHQYANLVHLESSTANSMKISTAPAKLPPEGRVLRLRGQLMLDPSRLVHVHTRFGGEVISVADVKEGDQTRQLRVGDRVKAGELLAILWSKEIGEKKSDLVDAWSQLYLHETILRNLKDIAGGAVAQRTVDEMQRNYEADLIEVTRLRRTLRSWRIDEGELVEIEKEAKRLHELSQSPANKPAEKPVTPEDHQLELHWAEIEIRAPRDGIVLEKNFTVGDIVDTNFDLFKIADLSRLSVMANVYEEDLPRLDSLPHDRRLWRIELHSLPDHPPLDGKFESIGHLIDPNQHTAVVTGWIENPEGLLRVGQFVETVIDLPADKEVLELPVASILDAGDKAFVFVSKDEQGTQIEKREVRIVRRTADFVWVAAANVQQTAGKIIPALLKPLEVGQRVVVGGVVEINAALGEIQPANTSN